MITASLCICVYVMMISVAPSQQHEDAIALCLAVGKHMKVTLLIVSGPIQYIVIFLYLGELLRGESVSQQFFNAAIPYQQLFPLDRPEFCVSTLAKTHNSTHEQTHTHI